MHIKTLPNSNRAHSFSFFNTNVIPVKTGIQWRSKHATTRLLAWAGFRVKPGMTKYMVFFRQMAIEF
jgi:hypothetical protein